MTHDDNWPLRTLARGFGGNHSFHKSTMNPHRAFIAVASDLWQSIRHGLGGGRQAILAVLACMTLAGFQVRAMAAAPPSVASMLTQAEVSHDDGATWTAIALPDEWSRRGPQDRAAAQYRLPFELTSVPSGPMAISFERLGMYHRLSLNGHLLAQRGDGPDFVNRRGSAPTLIDLPPALLRAGRNDLMIEVQHAGNGVLSAPRLGPTDSLRRAHAFRELWDVDLPQSLNLASLGLGLFMLTVWIRRPVEVTLGCFGAMTLITALRNLAYFTTLDLAPPGLLDWFFYSSQVVTAVLLGLFARALTGQQGRLHLRVLWSLALLLPLAAAVCATLDYANLAERLAAGPATTRMGQLRRWTYPVLMLATLPALAWLLQMARKQARRSVLLLALGVGALLLGGLHDYAVQIGRPVLTGQFVLPFVFPLVLGAMSVYLVARMVAATGAAEALSRELDERVALRTRQLSLANEAKARFLSAASHDLRQPVMAIGLLVSLLRDRASDAAATQALVTKLHGATRAMESLLNGLLDLSRLDPSLVAPHLQAVRLQSMFDAIAQHEQPEADRKRLRLRFRRSPLVVHADPVLLEQVLRNLVSNALRYTSRGGVLVTARTSGATRVRLQVWDTGIGIAPQDQSHVFEEFVQLGNPGRDRRLGQGLGLAIVQRGADAMGATLSLRSVPGRGSCFGITLPGLLRLPTTDAGAGAGSTGPAASAAPDPLRGRLVWVLDNDDELRDVLVWRLQAWGASVIGLASLAALQQRIDARRIEQALAPDLLLTDQRLSDGTGYEAITLFRQALGGNAPCILVTGDASSVDAQALARQGIPVLAKPASDGDLLALTESALQDCAT
jgi:signal transduction histidine kinase/ActR/RegA family two-component response regulator